MEVPVGLIFQWQKGFKRLLINILKTDIYDLCLYMLCLSRLSAKFMGQFLVGHCIGLRGKVLVAGTAEVACVRRGQGLPSVLDTAGSSLLQNGPTIGQS